MHLNIGFSFEQIINVAILIIIVDYTTEDDIYNDSFCYLIQYDKIHGNDRLSKKLL